MAWCFEDETNAYTETVLDKLNSGQTALMPTIWKFGVSNVLLIIQRKQRISLLKANNFKNALTSLPIHIDHGSTDRAFDTVFEIGRELGLTAYDSAYLELAFREKIPLAIQDKALIKAAQEISVDIF